MKRDTGKQLLNLGLKVALMLKDKLMKKIPQIWQEMKFTDQDKKQLKYLLSRKGKRKRGEIWNEIKEKGAQKLGLSSTNGEAYQNLEERVKKLKEKLKQLGED